MQATRETIPPQQLAEQITNLLAHGGTLGSVYNYTDEDYELLYSLGHSFYSQGRYLDAVKAFGYLVIHNHLESRFANAYAASLQMIKSYEEALTYYSLVSVMDMSDPAPTFHSAECLLALGRVEEAREALGIVLGQCAEPRHAAMKARAEALRSLIDKEQGGKHG